LNLSDEPLCGGSPIFGGRNGPADDEVISSSANSRGGSHRAPLVVEFVIGRADTRCHDQEIVLRNCLTDGFDLLRRSDHAVELGIFGELSHPSHDGRRSVVDVAAALGQSWGVEPQALVDRLRAFLADLLRR